MKCCGSPAKSVDVKSLTSYDLAPTRDDMVAAKLLYVKMKMNYTSNPDITSISDLRAYLGDGQGTAPWAALPGLRHKYFTYHSDTQTTCGVYVFFSQAELDSYMDTDLFKGAPSWPHVSKLTAEVMDVVPGTEKSIEKTQWPHTPPTREDLTAGKMLIVDITMDYTTGMPNLPASKEDLYYFFDAGGYTENFAAVEGLRGKYFAYDDKTDHVYGFYTFINEASLREYMDSDLFKQQGDGAHIAALTYQVQDILEGTERSMDLGSW
jgi:hypothetical protein